MAFPRLNNVSFWLLFSSLILAVSAMTLGEGIGTGWTMEMLSLNSTQCENILKSSFLEQRLTLFIKLIMIILISTTVSILYTSVIMILKVKKTIRLQSNTNTVGDRLHQRLNVEHSSFNFNEWLVGFTDGDGTFSMTKGRDAQHSQFTFKLTQSIYNYRILYFIKKQIGYGSITKSGPNDLQYRIRDTKILKEIIIPIFDSYPLHTSKYYSYNLWKEALLNSEIRPEVDYNKTKFKELPLDYRSPHNQIPTKNWIIGFIEAEGSFYLTKKQSKTDENRIVHSVLLGTALDYHLLEQLKTIFKINAKIKSNKNGTYQLETSNSRNIEFLIKYFSNKFKGVKSLELKIWSRSYLNYKGNYKKLLITQSLLRNIRNKHKLTIH